MTYRTIASPCTSHLERFSRATPPAIAAHHVAARNIRKQRADGDGCGDSAIKIKKKKKKNVKKIKKKKKQQKKGKKKKKRKKQKEKKKKK